MKCLLELEINKIIKEQQNIKPLFFDVKDGNRQKY